MTGTAGRRRRRRARRRRPAARARPARRPGARRAPPAARRRERDHPGQRRARPPSPRRRGSRRTRAACRGPAASSAAATSSNDRHFAPPGRPCPGAPDPPGQLGGSRSAASIRYHTTVPANRDAIWPSSVRLAVACGSEHQHDAVGGEVEQAAAGEPGGRRWRELRREVQPAFTHPAPRTSKSGGTAGAAPAPVFRTRRASAHGTAPERSGAARATAPRGHPRTTYIAYAGRGHGVACVRCGRSGAEGPLPPPRRATHDA